MRILEDRPELWPFLLLSLIIHALIVGGIKLSLSAPSFEENRPIEVFTVTELPKKNRPYRIADIAKPAEQKRPKDAQFLGMYDSSVKRETVGISRPVKIKKTKIGGTKRKRRARKARKRRKKVTPGLQKDKLLAMRPSLFEGKPNPVEQEEGASSEGGVPDDFYPDFRRGPNTYLNVLRYPGVGYFVRMKRAFKITFNPEPSLRSYFTVNRVARGSIDVVLGVSVDQNGELAELFLFRGSGIAAYDQEAMRTVRASSPFSTPPEKFLADDGLLRMSWTFTVYL